VGARGLRRGTRARHAWHRRTKHRCERQAQRRTGFQRFAQRIVEQRFAQRIVEQRFAQRIVEQLLWQQLSRIVEQQLIGKLEWRICE
jgi:hypothetical protein